MARGALPDLSIALTFLRLAQGWSQTALAEVAGTAANVINDYERDRKTLHRERLEELVAHLGLPPEAVDEALAGLAKVRTLSRISTDPADPFAETRRRVGAFAVRAGALIADAAREVLLLLTFEGQALHERQRAEGLFRTFVRRKPAERRLLVEEGRRFRSWALAERAAAESVEKAANHPAEALEWAELALRVAELAPGDAAWRSRLQGYAWAHLANARRVNDDLQGAEEALARAWKLWEEGAEGDPGILSPAWLPWIEAVLRRAQRRFPIALKRIEEALELDGGALRGKILLSKAQILEVLGAPQEATSALTEAAPYIDDRREPRLALVLRFNLLVSLCHLERAAEADSRLAEVRGLAEQLGEPLDLVRVVWLEGKVAAGLGRAGEARAALEQARRELDARKLAYDFALVSLDLALLLLGEERTAEVRVLAEEMLWIFRAKDVHREALAALRLFCDAAGREAATIELAQKVSRYLYRARHDAELPFESEEAGTP